MKDRKTLPNPLPRPPGEFERLRRPWTPPRGIHLISAVNNTYIGIYYVGAAFAFFLLAGILALLMRIQLAVPENDFLSAETYNQVFTMHGTMMMFLFAVPAVEAMGVYLLPNMQAARDLPFPRLSAYAFWAYALGGTVFFLSLFFDLAPKSGWFMYPPLSSFTFSPGHNADFWLLGIGFIEISAIAGAIEIIVGVLRTRAPGQSLAVLPVYSWAMLVFAVMIVIAFPAVILCTALLEIERSFHWPFFIAEKGGDPLLWQHLFWFFGHPEVYIIFLPAAGFISTMLPTLCRTPLVGYKWVVLAIVATGFISFGVWVHHMFTTGIPRMSVSFFAAASMAVSVPSGIQVFAWIATIARGRLLWTTPPALFILGFLAIFTVGGLTGVMVAVVQFDWQVHDTYFIVAHFHYVLVGGMVFPLFAALYYWIPTASRRPLSTRLGRWVFGLMFTGFNISFFPMHISGLWGMPRRVFTYPAGMGWEALNLTSTIGAMILAAGVGLFVVDLLRNFRPFSGDNAGDIWGAATLEWLPGGNYNTHSIPATSSLYPLWDDPDMARDVKDGGWYLPDAPTGGRETIVTSPLEARPEFVLRIPGPSWSTVLAAWFTAGFFLLLTVKLVWPALALGLVALVLLIAWLWSTDPPPHPPVAIGGGITLPVTVSGPQSHSWWAMVVLMLVSASLFACLIFAYVYLWMVSPGYWPRPEALPHWTWPFLSAGLWLVSSAVWGLASRALGEDRRWLTVLLMLAALPLLSGGLLAELWGQWQAGVRPTESVYGAIVFMVATLQGVFVAVLTVMGLYTVARGIAGMLGSRWRNTFDNTRIFWHYGVAQGLVGLALVHLAPWVLA